MGSKLCTYSFKSFYYNISTHEFLLFIAAIAIQYLHLGYQSEAAKHYTHGASVI